jgi:two-component system chemotaxis response regulator CheB
MHKIRVMVVDDAVVFRRLIADELNRDPALEVVGTAVNGRVALAKLPELNPDLVVLDVEMPEMDGLATLRELRKMHPRLPVIMFSALTERGAAATLDALALGASDYFAKPAAAGMDASLQVVRERLVPQIKALGRRTPAGTPAAPPAPARAPARGRPQVVVIGASTGGPNALGEVFRRLPGALPVPVLVVQHMPATFTRLFAERLSAEFKFAVQEGLPGAVLQAGHVWIAPGDHHLTVVKDAAGVRLRLSQTPPENSCRPAVDVLLRSVAHTFGADSLTVILTGMGQDGLRGCEAVRAAGGQVLAQDEASSVVWGMPGHVARAGLADRVLPLADLADEIVRRVQPFGGRPS